jgi:hypothetical protein
MELKPGMQVEDRFFIAVLSRKVTEQMIRIAMLEAAVQQLLEEREADDGS